MLESFIDRLQSRETLPPLFPSQVWDTDLSRQIQNTPGLSDGVRAGLLLWNDDLEASHTISQGIHTATGSFWHAIMHRREGDASNSLYWWRRTGTHPAFAAIYKVVLAALNSEADKAANEFAATLQRDKVWRPDEFVTACQRGRRGSDDKDDKWLRQVQVIEMETLLRWCQEHGE